MTNMMNNLLARRRRGAGPGRHNERGFTLVEMLVVITIIALIMALVGPRVLNYLTDAKIKTARIQISSFENALDLYYLDANRYPTTSEGLRALDRTARRHGGMDWALSERRRSPERSMGATVCLSVTRRAWAYDIMSYGADGQEGGAGSDADITSWTK